MHFCIVCGYGLYPVTQEMKCINCQRAEIIESEAIQAERTKNLLNDIEDLDPSMGDAVPADWLDIAPRLSCGKFSVILDGMPYSPNPECQICEGKGYTEWIPNFLCCECLNLPPLKETKDDQK